MKGRKRKKVRILSPPVCKIWSKYDEKAGDMRVLVCTCTYSVTYSTPPFVSYRLGKMKFETIRTLLLLWYPYVFCTMYVHTYHIILYITSYLDDSFQVQKKKKKKKKKN